MPNWDIKKGDLLMDKLINPLRFEIKGSIDLSNGPPTFGPKESWNYIYFKKVKKLIFQQQDLQM